MDWSSGRDVGLQRHRRFWEHVWHDLEVGPVDNVVPVGREIVEIQIVVTVALGHRVRHFPGAAAACLDSLAGAGALAVRKQRDDRGDQLNSLRHDFGGPVRFLL